MSRQAIAAVLARTDLASGERLVALSLASFAGRENRAWPGAPAASARAGLSRSRYQQAREQLVARGLVAVDERATGRGRASTVTLVFADAGPWWDGEINVELFEAVLTLQPGARTRAAAAGDDGALSRTRTEPCATSRPSSCALRRGSRTGLTGARGLRCSRRAGSSSSAASAAAGTRTCGPCAIRARSATRVAARSPRRVAPPAGARPLVASAVSPAGARVEPASAAGRKGRSGSDTYRRETVRS